MEWLLPALRHAAAAAPCVVPALEAREVSLTQHRRFLAEQDIYDVIGMGEITRSEIVQRLFVRDVPLLDRMVMDGKILMLSVSRQTIAGPIVSNMLYRLTDEGRLACALEEAGT